MEMPRLSKSVRRVVRLTVDDAGKTSPVVLYETPRGEKRKKGSTGLKVVDKAVRRTLDAQHTFLESYRSRHDRSNSKNRDGWLFDLGQNAIRAGRKGTKKLKLNRPPM